MIFIIRREGWQMVRALVKIIRLNKATVHSSHSLKIIINNPFDVLIGNFEISKRHPFFNTLI